MAIFEDVIDCICDHLSVGCIVRLSRTSKSVRAFCIQPPILTRAFRATNPKYAALVHRSSIRFLIEKTNRCKECGKQRKKPKTNFSFGRVRPADCKLCLLCLRDRSNPLTFMYKRAEIHNEILSNTGWRLSANGFTRRFRPKAVNQQGAFLYSSSDLKEYLSSSQAGV